MRARYYGMRIVMSTEQVRGFDVALIARAVPRLSRRLRAESRGALSGSAISLLTALYRVGPMAGVTLAQEEGLKPQSLSRLLAMLEREGLVERNPDPEDRRHLMTTITIRGRAALLDAGEARRTWLTDVMTEKLSPAERATLIEAAGLMLRIAR